jgi:hypothetical protein
MIRHFPVLLFQMAPSPQNTTILSHKRNFQVSISISFKHPVHFIYNRPYRKVSQIAVTANRYKYGLYRQQVAVSYRLTTHLVSVAPAASNRPSTLSNDIICFNHRATHGTDKTINSGYGENYRKNKFIQFTQWFTQKTQQDARAYQNFISYLYEAQHVSGDTPPIISSLKLHW